jgi:hypothetical protein
MVAIEHEQSFLSFAWRAGEDCPVRFPCSLSHKQCSSETLHGHQTNDGLLLMLLDEDTFAFLANHLSAFWKSMAHARISLSARLTFP